MEDLVQYRHSQYSQNGEDGIIEAILSLVGISNRWCLEVGAHDGVEYSNTYSLVRQGWNAICIEFSCQFEAMERTYKDYNNAILVRQQISPRAPDDLDTILGKHGAPIDIQLAVIDIDGDDYHVWKALEIYKPEIVMIEFNPSFPLNVEFIQKEGEYIGSSLLSLVLLGIEKGYNLVCVVANNAIFLHKSHQIDIPNKDFRYLYYAGVTETWSIAQSFGGAAFIIDPNDHMKNQNIRGYQELYDMAERIAIHEGGLPWQF